MLNNLLEIDSNGQLQITPEALVIKPYNDIWIRDKTKAKNKARAELAYIWYMHSFKSNFIDIEDLEERTKTIMENIVGLPEGWKPDAKVKKAEEHFESTNTTTALKMLLDAKYSINKLSQHLRGVNFDEVEYSDNGLVKPKYNVKQYADTIEKIPKIVKALGELENAVKKEKEEESGMRGGHEKSDFEDGIQ